MTRLPTIGAGRARRLALAAQGFAAPRPSGRIDVRHLRKVLATIGLVQVDSVNVAVRTQYMPFFSRLGPYPMSLLDEMAYRRRELFEYWGHVASLMPVARWPELAFRREGIEPGGWVRSIMREHPGYLDSVLEEVRERGPLTVSDLEDPGTRTGPWWGYGKGKIALGWHFDKGALTVADRRNFARVYDLPERVYPAEVVQAPPVPKEEAYRRLLRQAAGHLGVATAADLADYHRLKVGLARPILAGMVAAGTLAKVRVEGWDRDAYLDPAITVPNRITGRALVSPFDSLVWYRDRVERLFGFHYRIEIYTPKEQRRHGYYVMPFLLDGDLVARVDLKADRRAGVLRVPGAFVEHGAEPARVAPELAAELHDIAHWLGLGEVADEDNGDLAPALRAIV